MLAPCLWFGLALVSGGSCGNCRHFQSFLLPLLPSLCLCGSCYPKELGDGLGISWALCGNSLRHFSDKSQVGEGSGASQDSQGFRRHPSAHSGSSALSGPSSPERSPDSSLWPTMVFLLSISLVPPTLHRPVSLNSSYIAGLLSFSLTFHVPVDPRIFAQAIPSALKILPSFNSCASSRYI